LLVVSTYAFVQEEEAYVCIYSHRNGDTILFHHEGGVDIGDVDAKAKTLHVPIDTMPSVETIRSTLLTEVAKDKQGYA
jgi:ATP citrate (pro-S)-lyase